MLSRLLREIIFAGFHLLVTVFFAIRNVLYRWWVQRGSVTNDKVTIGEVMKITNVSSMIKTRLRHLVLLADTDHHSLNDLAKIVIWSLVYGIPYVSFYDMTGNLQEQEEELFTLVQKNKKGISGYIKWSNKPDLNGYTYSNNAHTVHINIFNASDGKQKIVDCVRQLAEGKITYNQHSDEFTAQEFHDFLKPFYPCIPDPELVLYTGSCCCTNGFLPWHMRLTEFIQLSLNHRISVDNYINSLSKFSKCNQRFGK